MGAGQESELGATLTRVGFLATELGPVSATIARRSSEPSNARSPLPRVALGAVVPGAAATELPELWPAAFVHAAGVALTTLWPALSAVFVMACLRIDGVLFIRAFRRHAARARSV